MKLTSHAAAARRVLRICGPGAAAMLAAAAPQLAEAQSAGQKLNFELRGRAEYDTNAARGSKTVAAAQGIDPNDIRYTVSAGVDAARLVGRQSIFMSGTVSYDFYSKNNSLDRWRADLTGGAAGRVGPCATTLNAGYLQRLSELSPISPTDPRDSTERVLSYGGSTSCPIVGNIGATASVQRRQVRTSGSQTQLGNDITSLSTSIGYVSRTFGSVSVFGSYTDTNYKQQPGPVPLGSQGFQSYSVGLQYSRPIGTRLTGQAGINYYELHRSAGTATAALAGGDTSGTAWNVGFNYRASSRLTMDVGYSDSTGATTQVGSAYQREKRINAGVSYSPSSRLSVSLSGDRVNRDYSGRGALPLVVASEEQRTRIGAGITYDLGRLISVGLDASQTKVETDQALLNYTSERIAATIIAKF